MKVLLAEALLRRKELQEKVSQLAQIKKESLAEVRIRRQQVTDTLEDIEATVPKVSMQQLTHVYDHHARALRLVDAAIQQANWTTELDLDQVIMDTYVDPYVK